MSDEMIHMDDEDREIMREVWQEAEEEAKKRGVEGAGSPPKRAGGGDGNVRKEKGEDGPVQHSAQWDESKHPRANDGKFGSGEVGGGEGDDDIPDEDLHIDDRIAQETVMRRPSYEPINDVDHEKVNAIAASMQKDGWTGDPLVVTGEQALTGSHRLHGAWKANLPKIPVVEVDQDDIVRAASELGYGDTWEELHIPDNEAWLHILEETGNEAAIELMRREVEKSLYG